jgi:hypothetical protein
MGSQALKAMLFHQALVKIIMLLRIICFFMVLHVVGIQTLEPGFKVSKPCSECPHSGTTVSSRF